MGNSVSKVILSFLAGAAAGTALGILLAPDKGEETRLKVKEQFDEINESARKLYEKYKPKAQAVVEEDED